MSKKEEYLSDNGESEENEYSSMRAQNSRPLRDRVLVEVIHITEYIGLVVITIATMFAAAAEVMHMVSAQTVTLGDLLLLFLYLEVLAMIGIYLKSGKLPIRFPIYIAIVALARLLILDLKELTEWEMIAIAGTITLLTFAVLILRYGHIKLPYILNRRKDD
ncbi:MAG: phosphate-starvation-inducible PsiE family protein [Pseudomonadota bacterium]|nr:phosphate-starvation-inducible PsiE family protein [Pseudomonadota bacterium]